MAERWFTVPVIGDGTMGNEIRPKYSNESGINGWIGQIVAIDTSDNYVVRFYGTSSALDTIESYSDTTSLQESGLSKTDVESYLNDKTGHSYSFSEWETRFLTA